MLPEELDGTNLDEVKADHSGSPGGKPVKGAEVEDAENINTEDPKADKKKKKGAEEAGKGPNKVGTDVKMGSESTEADEDADEIQEDDEKEDEVPVPVTKSGMINAVLEQMRSKPKAELEGLFGDVIDALDEAKAKVDEDDDDDDEDDEDTDIDDEMDDDDEPKNGKKEKKNPFVKKEDLDLSADTAALFEGENLSEEFMVKATTIFEAATVSKINEKLTEIVAENEAEMEAAKVELVEEMSAKVDGYLEYVVEEWSKDNELAIESGIRSELAEDFIYGLKGLMEDHYIDVPEDKVDVLEVMGNRIAELESQLDDSINETVEIRAKKEDLQKDDILDEIADKLVDTDAEKLRSLAEGVDFEDEDSYRVALGTLKENYFPGDTDYKSNDDADTDGLTDEKEVPGDMTAYVENISRHIKK